jgi:endonuclease YncB( thermonuclease family)
MGVDTPEKGWRARCKAEDAHANAARVFTEESIQNDTDTYNVVLHKWDKYGGRVLGDLYFTERKQYLSSVLIQRGFGVSYLGLGPKTDWCA